MKTSTAIALAIAFCLVLSASMIATVLQQQRALQRLQAENAQLRKMNATGPALSSSFANISPDDLPGTYRWSVNGEAGGTVILHPDRTVTNWRGEKKTYQWQLSDGALVLNWQKDPTVFTRVISPGIYEGKRDGKVYRIEKEN